MTVKESRGRLSYLTPDRTKPITARKLGDDFDRAAVLAVLEQNAARAAEKATAIFSTPPSIQDQLRADRAARTAPKQDGVQRLLDIEQKKAEGKGRGYERWATMHNLKQMAATLNVYQEYANITELDAATLNRLIKEIVVHEHIDEDKTRHISIEIHFNLKPIPEVEQVTA